MLETPIAALRQPGLVVALAAVSRRSLAEAVAGGPAGLGLATRRGYVVWETRRTE